MPFSRRTLGFASAAFLLIGGIAMIAVGVWFFFDHARFVGPAQRADGVVEDVVGRRGARGHTLYYPVVRYRPAGRVADVVFTASPGLWPLPFAIGDRVTVAYGPADPSDAKIDSFWMLWFMPGAVVLLGIGCLFAGWHTGKKLV